MSRCRALPLRLAALLALALALSPEPASAQVPAGSRIFTLAGGGAARPHDGAVATSVRIGDPDALDTPLAAMRDGSIATIDALRNPLLIGLDGRIRMLPRIVDHGRHRPVGLLAAQPDGTLLAGPDGVEPAAVYRLAVGASDWSVAASLRPILRSKPDWILSGLAALPSGGFAIAGYDGLRRVGPDGKLERLAAGRPGRSSPRSLAALPDGSLAFSYGDGDAIAVLAPDGALRRIQGAYGAYHRLGLAATADGTLLRAEEDLDSIAPDGAVRPIAGHRPWLGTGDGGPPGGALLNATDVAVAADGAIVVAEITPFGIPRPRWDLPAYRLDGRLQTSSIAETDSGPMVRIIVPPGSERPLAALTGATFKGLRRGWVEYVTTVPGLATLTVRRRGARPVRVSSSAAAGVGRLQLPRGRRSGDDALALVVRTADGRAAAGDLAATTARRLSRRRARRIISRVLREDTDIGYSTRMGRCRRRSAVRIDCQSISELYEDAARFTACDGVASALLRPDGVRVVSRSGRRRCRAIGKAR